MRQGLDFDDYMSPVTEAHLKSHTARYHQRTAAMRWLLNFLIGCSVALVVSARDERRLGDRVDGEEGGGGGVECAPHHSWAPSPAQAVAIIYCARQLTKWKFAAVYLLIGEAWLHVCQ
jgi:hypothetical protein